MLVAGGGYPFERQLRTFQCQSIYVPYEIVPVKVQLCTLQDIKVPLNYSTAMYPIERVHHWGTSVPPQQQAILDFQETKMYQLT